MRNQSRDEMKNVTKQLVHSQYENYKRKAMDSLKRHDNAENKVNEMQAMQLMVRT